MKTREMRFDCNGSTPRVGDILRPSWPLGRAWYTVTAIRPIDTDDDDRDPWLLTVARTDPPKAPDVAIGTRVVPYVPHDYDERPACANCRRRVPIAAVFALGSGFYHPYQDVDLDPGDVIPCGPVHLNR